MLRPSIVTLLALFALSPQILADDLVSEVAKAEAGNFDAMLHVGLAYLSDQDGANNEAGIKWLEMSSAGGNVTAYYNLGVTYQDGEPVKHNSHKAIMYLTLAAELGEIRAMNRLAGIHYVGKLVPTNDILAVKWGLCAATLGSKTSQENMKTMQAEIDQKSTALGANMAKEWLKRRFPGTEKLLHVIETIE